MAEKASLSMMESETQLLEWIMEFNEEDRKTFEPYVELYDVEL